MIGCVNLIRCNVKYICEIHFLSFLVIKKVEHFESKILYRDSKIVSMLFGKNHIEQGKPVVVISECLILKLLLSAPAGRVVIRMCG